MALSNSQCVAFATLNLAIQECAIERENPAQLIQRNRRVENADENAQEAGTSCKHGRIDDGDDDNQSTGRRERTSSDILMEAFAVCGKHLARTTDVFASWAAVLRDGLKREVDSNLEDTVAIEKYSDEEQANHRIFDALLESLGTRGVDAHNFIEDLLDDATGPSLTMLAEGQLSDHCRQAKTNDNATLKTCIIEWLDFPHGLTLWDKSTRGFKRSETASLLLPMSQRPYSSEKRHDIADGLIKLDSADWPLFLWKGNFCDENDRKRRIGLFKGELLIQTAKAIFTSPSSATSNMRSRRPSNSTKNAMNKITPASIAYTVMILYYALSSNSVFSEQTVAGFNLKAFYYGIIRYFEKPSNTKHVVSLLTWWNKQIFPNSGLVSGNVDSSGIPDFADDDEVDGDDDE